jgi:hypothetical protein
MIGSTALRPYETAGRPVLLVPLPAGRGNSWHRNSAHPIGAIGAAPATRLMHPMKRDGCRRGIVTPCIGGGQVIALAIEMP